MRICTSSILPTDIKQKQKSEGAIFSYQHMNFGIVLL